MGVPEGTLTSDDVAKNFQRYLQDAIDTGAVPGSNTGLDENVIEAIRQIAREYPLVTPTSVQNAQQCWRRQLSGQTGAEAWAATARSLAARGYDTGDSLA